MEGMERRFAGIASSIQDLTRHTMMRAVNMVHDDLINTIDELDKLESINWNSRLIEAY